MSVDKRRKREYSSFSTRMRRVLKLHQKRRIYMAKKQFKAAREWVEKNKYSVARFNNFSYMACGKGNSNADEVFIYNYATKPIDKGLFSL